MPTNASKILREVKQFEAYVRYAWPLHRVFARRYLTPRCQRCFLTPKSVSHHKGVCLYCLEGHAIDDSVRQTEAEELNETLKALAVGKNRYHALVLFSGGKDSAYLLFRLKQQYPALRLLALTVDNTFMSPVALSNVEDLVERMGVEHLVFRPEAQTMEKMFRRAFLQRDPNGCSGTVDRFDGDFFSDVARNIALALNIPAILCGLSRVQVQRILGLRSFITSKAEEGKNRTEVAGISLEEVFSTEEMRHWWHGAEVPEQKRPQMIFPHYVWNLDDETIRRDLTKNLLIPSKEQSPLATNNLLIPLMGIVDMIRLGYSSFEPEFAEQVRAGKSDRKTWLYTFELLEYSAKTGAFISDSVDQVLKRLGLKRSDLGIPQ